MNDRNRNRRGFDVAYDGLTGRRLSDEENPMRHMRRDNGKFADSVYGTDRTNLRGGKYIDPHYTTPSNMMFDFGSYWITDNYECVKSEQSSIGELMRMREVRNSKGVMTDSKNIFEEYVSAINEQTLNLNCVTSSISASMDKNNYPYRTQLIGKTPISFVLNLDKIEEEETRLMFEIFQIAISKNPNIKSFYLIIVEPGGPADENEPRVMFDDPKTSIFKETYLSISL